MRKRIMTLLLAVILLFHTEAGTLYAMEGLPQAYTDGAGVEIPNEGNNGTTEEGKVPGEDGSETENPDGGDTEKPNPGDGNGSEDTNPGDGSETENPDGEDTKKPNPGDENDSETSNPGEGEGLGEQETKEYTITFDFNGGTITGIGTSQPVKIKNGENLTSDKAPVPERIGYKLRGWAYENGTLYDFEHPVPIQDDLILTASWAPITYTLKFKANGGTGTMPNQVFEYDNQERKLPVNTFVRTGYAFTDWTCEISGATYHFSEEAPILNLVSQDGAVIVFKANWTAASYMIQFHANGGTGEMDDLACVYGKSKTLTKNGFKRTGYAFKGWSTKPDGTGTAYANKAKVKSLTTEDQGVVTLYAIWEGYPYTIKYDGNGASSGSMANSSHVYGTSSDLSKNLFKRKGYTFAGWNTKADGKGTNYTDGAKVNGLTSKKNGTVTLYAKWTAVKYTITYRSNGGKLSSSAKKTYTIDKSFLLPRPTRKGYDFDGWYKTSNFKNRIGEITKGSTGNLTLYAKWVKCAGKAKSDSAKLTSCKATGTGKVQVKAKIKTRVASSDDYYYLMYINPMNNKMYKAAAKAYKKTTITFNLKTAENQGYATSKFGIAVKKGNSYKLISAVSYVKNAEKAASNKSKYKAGQTKKGIQFETNMEEVINSGAKQNFLNVTVSMVCDGGTVPYQYNGKTYYFNPMTYYQQVVAECNRRNINVTMQVMLDWTEGNTDMIAAKARVRGAAPFYSWNVTTNSAREKMEAIFCYLGKLFGKKNCYVSNWILGNEVNNPSDWHYKGGMSTTAYFKAYAYAFRALYYAVRSQYSNAHIFICTDNLWNTAVKGGYSAKYVISSFVAQLNKIEKGLKWNLAYHAYSSPLTYTNFWAGYGITNDVNTPYITMKNLDVLTNYIKRTYGSSVRIILSEQGYSSAGWGEANQAAAIVYSYYIAACNPMIDAFIIRSYSDHPVEVAQGLRMGIAGKEAFNAFKYMDTSKASQYTKKYLGMLGAASWKNLVPGYKASRVKEMYRKS